ncbi:MAG: hypothetical protein JNK63_03065 [Chthonomonas sp.]|nr:hypothetical protein [Chthonomonas sp.]
MSYFVIDPTSGQKYGPADTDTLNVWIREGRVTPETQLEDAISGSTIGARAVAGLTFDSVVAESPSHPQFKEPPKPSRPSEIRTPTQVPGQQDATNAWIYFALGFAVCSVIFLPMSIIAANKAAMVGNNTAYWAKVLSVVLIVLNVLALVVLVMILGAAANSA